jgi:hypothetical protein
MALLRSAGAAEYVLFRATALRCKTLDCLTLLRLLLMAMPF